MYKHYTLIEEKQIEELNGSGHLFTHNKSGARILVIKNEDKNKTFSIAFRTPPIDDTGLPHILEHSVLCGSRKFPLKDPFVELAKGSLNTFLNAMTFSDKTMYPVASMNDQDFTNLMDVYLDAVLYPNIHHDPMILKQEGWHYELNNPEDEVIYKGVVYNEMKGAFSNADQVLFRRIQQSLFPDNAYNFESGGDPEFIPELDSETFLNYHKSYYHPSNSYIFLYGDVDIEEKLTWLDTMYLKDFDAIEIDSAIKLQKPFKSPEEFVMSYPISSNEDTEDKTFLSMNFVTGACLDKCEYIGLEILEYILLEAPGAVLKKALTDAGIGKDVYGSFDNSIMQPTFSIVAKQANPEQKERFVKIIQETFTTLSKTGLDQDKVEAAINYFEFKIKEADFGRYPKGIIYAIKALDSWLYDQSPFEHFEYNEAFKHLKEGSKNGCLNGLIQKYFLDNPHVSVLTLEPDSSLVAKREGVVKKTLKMYKDGLSKGEIAAIIEQTKALETYQNQPEEIEAVLSIPLLSLEDVDKKANILEMNVEVMEGAEVLIHHAFTNDILYMKWLFDLSVVEESDLPLVKLLSALLGKMTTTNYNYSELSNQINLNTGGINFGVEVYNDVEVSSAYYPKLEINGKCFMDKTKAMLALVEEIMMSTEFTDLSRLKELLLESKSRIARNLSSSGHVTAATRAMSYFSASSKVKDYFGGIGYYMALTELIEELDKDPESFIERLQKIRNLIFKGCKLIIGTTYQDTYDDLVEAALEEHLDLYDNEVLVPQRLDLIPEKLNEGFMTSDEIQYVAKAGNFKDKGYDYHGSMVVLRSIISLDYLWTNIRIKGGAYGAMANFSRSGNMYFVSYRDPNLIQTMHHYDVMCEYIDEFDADERELRKYILGSISTLDQPLTPSMENEKVIAQYVSGVTDDMIQQERDQVLGTTNEDIRDLSRVVQKVMGQNYLCVLGNEHKLKEEQDVFKEIKHLFK